MEGEFADSKLCSLLVFSNGRSSPDRSDELPYPVYGSNGVIGHAAETNAGQGAIIIGRVGSYCGSLYLSKEKCWVTDNAIRAKATRDNDSRFLFYLLGTLRLNNWRAGSGQPLLNQGILSSIPVQVPPLPEQLRIASILGALDDKIELNRRMNRTLEEMAQAIFKSWFIDFDGQDDLVEGELGLIPRGWRLSMLQDHIVSMKGGDWGQASHDEVATEPAYCIRGTDIPPMQRGELGKPPLRFLKRSSLDARELRDGDLVLEVSGGSPTQSTGRSLRVSKGIIDRFDHPLVASNFCRVLRPRDHLVGYYLDHLLRFLFDSGEFFLWENGTTGIKNLGIAAFAERYCFSLPTEVLLQAFSAQVSLLLDRIQLSGRESATLGALRDILLPKLISGEIRVPEAEAIVEDAL